MNGEVSLIVRKQVAGEPVVIDSGFMQSGASPATPPFTTSGFLILQTYPNAAGLIGATITTVNGNTGCTDVRTITFAEVYDETRYILEMDSLDCTYSNYTNLNPYTITIPGFTEEEFYLDLFENESISQNWRFTDLNNFQSTGAFSREFRIPFSDRNQDVLGPLFDVNYSAGIDNFFHYKLPAEIRVDTLPIASGYIRVRKIYKQKNVINEVEIAFYAETPDLFKAIGEKKLADIAALNDLNEYVIYDNVVGGPSSRIWTLLDRGQLWSEGGQEGTRRITNPAAPLYASDFTPAVTWDFLLGNIIAEAGFQLEAGSLQSILGSYYMPWCNSAVLNTDDLGYQYFFRAYNTSNVVIPDLIPVPSNRAFYTGLTESFDNNNSFDPTTGMYTAPAGGRYTFHFTFNFSTSSYTMDAARTRVSVFALINGTNEVQIGSAEYVTGTTLDFIYGFDFTPGDTLEIFFRRELTTYEGNPPFNGATAAVIVTPGTGALGSSLIEIIGTQFNYGQNIVYSANAPDMRQIDFLNDVIKMHNCIIISDKTNPNKISIVPYNSYIGSGNKVDWTSKLDIDKDITVYSTVDLQKAKTTFTYSAGDDYLSQVYKANNRVYGDYKAEGYTINPSTDPSTFAIGENSVQLVTRSTPCGVIDNSIVIIPQFINQQNEFVAPGPRCLYYAGSSSMQVFDDSDGIETAVTTSMPTLCNYSTTAPDIYDYDLNFAPEVPPFSIIGNPYNNLFNLYWRNSFNELYSPDARIMEASFALELSDILTFQFNDIIYINDSLWRILEIQDYKVGAFESTKVKLIKYLSSEADCTSTPSYAQVNGQVVFVNGTGDEVPATQSCCVRYGFTWSEGEGLCFVAAQGGVRPNGGLTGNPVNVIPRFNGEPVERTSGTTATGSNVTVPFGNNNALAVGDTLTLAGQVRGAAMVGKNVYTNLPGFHLGGGWTLDNRANGDGNHQYGAVILSAKDNVASVGATLPLTIEGIPSSYIELPNDTHMACLISINVYDFNSDNYMTKLCHVFFKKVGATATASAVTTMDSISSFPLLTLALTIDTATNTAQHRLLLTAGGLGFPYDLQATATIQYTQIR